MSYYDSTVGQYDNRIATCKNNVISCNQKIKALEDDIEELNVLKTRVGSLSTEFEKSVKNSKSKISKLPFCVFIPQVFAKMSILDAIRDLLDGPQIVKPRESILEALRKISDRISTAYNEIDRIRGEIARANDEISSLKRQRSNYIAKASAEKEEADKTNAD